MKKRYTIGLIITVYIVFNSFVIHFLPNAFFRVIAWIGNEEVFVI